MAGLKLLTLSQFPKDNTLAHHLWSTAWGQETFAPFDVDVVRDGTLLVDLDEPIPATCQVINNHPFISKHLKHVVVRNEYVTTLDTLMALSVEVPNSSIIVLGHPGTGKTIFLFYVLIYRLQRGLSTFYQKTAQSVLYFHKSGVYSIPANQEPDSVDWESDDIWSLFTSNRAVKEPGELIAGDGSEWFLIEAASHRERWSEWLKYKGFVDCYYMKTPSFAEVVMIHPHQKNPVGTEQDLYRFYQLYGPSIRDAFRYASPSSISAYRKAVMAALRTLRYDGLVRAVRGDMEADSHKVFLVEASLDDRRDCVVSVITDEVMKMVWEMYLEGQTRRVAEFATLFSNQSSSRSTAGWIVDTHVHPILLQAETRTFHPMQGLVKGVNIHYSYPGPTAMQFPNVEVQIPDLHHCSFSMTDPTTDFQLNCYYQPQAKNNPTFDALMFTQEKGQNYVTMYQVTLWKEHDVREKGLMFLDKYLDLPNGTASIPSPRIRYALVALKGEEVKSVFRRDWVENRWKGILDVYALEIEF